MPSQVMAVVPVIMNSLHKDVMRGRKERLGELWVPSAPLPCLTRR